MSIFGRLNIKSKNTDVISTAITSLVAPCQAMTINDGPAVDYMGDFVGWSDFAFGESASVSGLALKTLEYRERLTCAVSRTGHLTYSCQGKDLTAGSGGVLICDAQIVDVARFSENYSQFFITTSMKAIEEFARQKYGPTRRSMAGNYAVLPRTHLGAQSLSGFLPLISHLIVQRDVREVSPIQMRRCQDAFLEVIVSSLDSDGLFFALRRPTSGSGKHVQAAEEYMRAHAKLPIGVTEVAEAVGTSVRSLQLAYRRYTGTTPLARLQIIRLEGFHAELVSGASGSWKLIALNWGFFSTSRLLKHYKTLFGESPEQTQQKSSD